jgi:hypothetical protein
MRIHLLAVVALLTCPVSATPHTLDEYLQATRLDITRRRVVVELALTPGVFVASQVLALIDSDGDLLATPDEVAQYANRVVRDLSLRVDGRPYQLILGHAELPSWGELRTGAGVIRLNASADLALTPGRHRVYYQNSHDGGQNNVYLVNVLVSSRPDVSLQPPRRDRLQQSIELDVDASASLEGAGWWLLPIAGLAIVLVRRWRYDRRAAMQTPPAEPPTT